MKAAVMYWLPDPGSELTRDELISRLAVAEAKAGRAWRMIDIAVPKPTEKVTAETFRRKLDWSDLMRCAA